MRQWEFRFVLCIAVAVLLLGISTCFAQSGKETYLRPWTLKDCTHAAYGVVRAKAVFNVSTGDGRWEPTCN